MRIVTFCAHQPYLYLFAGMDLEMDLIQIGEQKRFLQNWNEKVRPLPAKWRVISWDEAKKNLARKRYHFAVGHNINDYIDFLPFKVPSILVTHTSLSSRLTEEKINFDPASYKRDLHELIQRSRGTMVWVSEHKRQDWNLPGEVIPLVVNASDYLGFTGEKPAILRVSNQLMERGKILRYKEHEIITKGFHLTLVGHNPQIPESQIAGSWDELKAHYQSHRMYLHTAQPHLEDGYNTAMLEAMGTGMPIISTPHPTSPVIDGYNGFISDDLDYLREKVALLMEDRDLALQLGANSRKTALERFNIQQFQDQWQALFKKVGRRR